MEHSTSLPWLSWPKKPWRGQAEVFERVWRNEAETTAKEPTGYGKTYIANGTIALVNRLTSKPVRAIVIVPQEGQHNQYTANCVNDFADVGLMYGRDVVVCDLRKESYREVVRKMRENRARIIVYVVTIQMLAVVRDAKQRNRDSSRLETFREIFSETDVEWVNVIDELHHYGEDKPWANALAILPKPRHRLAMSACAFRSARDEIFGSPHVTVLYRAAVAEGAIKPIELYVYDYWVEVVDGENGEVTRLTTRQLAGDEAGPAHIDINLPMRYREDYISPLLEKPLDRLIKTRAEDHPFAQAIVFCSRLDHARLVHKQIGQMFGRVLRSAVIGSGPKFDADEVAKAIQQFCPEKGIDPTLDVLVCVGMAGEGMNTRFVTETIHLTPHNRNNTEVQKMGRASRMMVSNRTRRPLVGNINVDGSSAYRDWSGRRIMDALEIPPEVELPPPPPLPPELGTIGTGSQDEPGFDFDNERRDGGDDFDPEGKWSPPPVGPDPVPLDTFAMGLEGIDTGDLFIVMNAVAQNVSTFEEGDCYPTSPRYEALYNVAIGILQEQKKRSPLNKEAEKVHIRNQIAAKMTPLAGDVVRALRAMGVPIDGRLVGRIKWAINHWRIEALGVDVPEADEDDLKRHHQMTFNLHNEISQTRALPRWLRTRLGF